ncbi:MAG TPA: TIGR02186 family protein [Rhizomicrobium sp.]|nr:TIGR02186 family protein [Rhizomicrobium sp.]
MVAAILCSLLATPALAVEDLVSGLSQDTVEISSNYTGTDITVFGAIEHLEDTGANDIVVVVRGPGTDMTVRKKDRVAGIWINRDQAKLFDMPSYYYLASTRPIDRLAAGDTLQRYGIGLAHITPGRVASHHDPEPFRLALVRHLQQQGLYGEAAGGVEFLSPTLFRAHVPVPASVPRGQYNAEVYLLRDGTVISAQSTPLFIDQTGLERRLYNFAHNSPLSYGLSTVLMAILLGWISSLIFRNND